jgi:hypothetical protein
MRERAHTAKDAAFDDRRRRPRVRVRPVAVACSRWTSGIGTFDTAIARAIDDLRSLYITRDGDGSSRQASRGTRPCSVATRRSPHWKRCRSILALPSIPSVTLARSSGTKENVYTEEQPGKIMHELRRGEMARSGEIPHVPYYGTIDATPLWLVLVHETWRWTGTMP